MSKYKQDLLLGLPQIITLVFSILKLTGVINWPWTYILLPVIAEVALVIGLLLLLWLLTYLYNRC